MFKRMLWCAIWACALVPPAALAQVGVIAGGIVAKDALNKISENVTGKITMATESADFVAEKSARELQLLLANADVVMGRNIEKTFDNLTTQQQNFLKTAMEMSNRLDGLSDKVLSIEQFAAMDLNTLLGQLPGIKGDAFLLKRVDGYSQVYREKGVYQVKFTGQAFTQKRRVKVSINGQPVQLLPFSTDYVAVAELPAELLNPSYSDTEVKRIKLKVESWEQRGAIKAFIFGSEKKVLDYETEVLLLPKKPARVHLVETTAGQGWSKEIYSTTDTALAAATGCNGCWRNYTVSVTIPKGSKMLEDLTKSAVTVGVGPGPWGNWNSGYTFSNLDGNGPLTVSRGFSHQIHDQHRTLWIEAFYRKPVVEAGTRIVQVKDIEGKEASNGLEYDRIYRGEFSNEYAGYTLLVIMFNGQRIELTQAMAGDRGIEHTFTNLSGVRRVDVRVRNPYN